MALKQVADNSSLWHDLGVSLHYRSQLCSGTEAQVLSAKAMNALQKAASLQPTNHKHWTALGVVAAGKSELQAMIPAWHETGSSVTFDT